MSRHIEEVWSALLKADLVEGAAPAAGNLDSPWYVKVLLAFSGWLASLFLLGFVGVGFAFVVESSVASLLAGAVMIGGAFAIFATSKNEFFEHVALAVSLAGQALIVWGIFGSISTHDEIVWLLIGMLQAALAVVMPNFVHRALSTLLASFALSLYFARMGLPYIFSGVVMFSASWLWLNEFRYPQYMKVVRSVGYGLVLALITLKGVVVPGGEVLWRFAGKSHEIWSQIWMGEAVAGVVMLFVVYQLLLRYDRSVSRRASVFALSGSFFIAVVSLKVPGISAGLVIMLLGFSGSNRTLLGLGLVSLLFNISSYYYLLDTTLLIKSQTLVIAGLFLLVARWTLMRLISDEKEETDV